MTAAEKEREEQGYRFADMVLDRIEAIQNARDAGVTGEELRKLIAAMPLYPNVARGAVMRMGKKWFLEQGYDRTLADAEYGPQWIDEVNDERFALTGVRE